MSTNKFSFHIKAPRSSVYRALTDADAISKWRVPQGMTSKIHVFEPKEGGKFRISLTYRDTKFTGKSASHTDTYHGYFKKLIPNELVIEVEEFETTDPAMKGQMTSTFRLFDKDGGTEVKATHEGLPKGVKPEDNEEGWRQSFAQLAQLLEKN
jgi:uncharacterized protein YndB with AHSA1/START domain